MADHSEIMAAVNQLNHVGVSYPVLVPNIKGFESALKSGAKEIAIFGAAFESFSRKNINCSIEESLRRFDAVMEVAKENDCKVCGYVFCVVGCPYEGPISPNQVAKVALAMYNMGCYEISLGDTIGVGTPGSFRPLLSTLLDHLPSSVLAVHCHDTYGQAVANIVTALELGISVVDASTVEAFFDFSLFGHFAVRDMRQTVAVGVIKVTTKKEVASVKNKAVKNHMVNPEMYLKGVQKDKLIVVFYIYV